MSTVASLLTALGYRLFDDPDLQSIDADSNPTQTEILQWLNDGCEVLINLLAERQSNFGRTNGQFTTSIVRKITDITQADPAVVTTSEAHGLAGTETVWIDGVGGMIEINKSSSEITIPSTTTISLTDIDASAYTEYTSGGIVNPEQYYDDFAATLHTPAAKGLLYYQANTYELEQTNENDKKNYGVSLVSRPEKYYFDSSGNCYLLPVPDKQYIVEIPYWTQHTTLDSSDDMPHGGFFDQFLLEGIVTVAKNRDEYALDFENFWRSFLMGRAGNFIKKRAGVPKEVPVD